MLQLPRTLALATPSCNDLPDLRTRQPMCNPVVPILRHVNRAFSAHKEARGVAELLRRVAPAVAPGHDLAALRATAPACHPLVASLGHVERAPRVHEDAARVAELVGPAAAAAAAGDGLASGGGAALRRRRATVQRPARHARRACFSNVNGPLHSPQDNLDGVTAAQLVYGLVVCEHGSAEHQLDPVDGETQGSGQARPQLACALAEFRLNWGRFTTQQH
mmetsp:Transcript_82756/g.229741  ORF Transcript_82756/g.229741 Transcript_82756/m.229741 type:complete len:220 (-) Transcript_82756:52-711(-)